MNVATKEYRPHERDVIAKDLIVQITIPNEMTAKSVPARNGNAAIPYQEYSVDVQRQVSGKGHILVNNMVGTETAGQTITCRAKIGLKYVKGMGKFLYVKLEELTEEKPQFEMDFARNFSEVMTAKDDGHIVHACRTYNTNLRGGVILKRL